MSLKQKAIDSGRWVTISTVIQTVIQFLQISILAKILDPADFGVVSISNTAIGFFSLFSNFGFFNSIISKQEKDTNVLSSIYVLGIVIGVIIFFLTFFSAGIVASFFKEDRLSKVIKLSSCNFLIIYFGVVYSALLQKELKFKQIALIDIISYLFGMLLTVKMAYDGYKELSLVYGVLLTNLFRTVFQVRFGKELFIPKLYFSLSNVSDHLRFGIYNFGEGIVSFIQGNWDNIVIGKLLGPKLLGYYTLAYQLAVFPINKINPLILQVAYPLLAKMKSNREELKNAYIKILDIVTFFNFPLLAGLFITVNSIVPLVYGPNWEQTYPLIRIFVFVSVAGCMSHPLFTIAYTREKPKLLFYLNLITLAAKIPLVYFLGKYGSVMGIATAFLIATMINFIFSFLIANFLIGNFFKNFISNVYKQILFCIIMVGVVSLYKDFVGHQGWFHTTMEIMIGSATYVFLTLRFKFSLSEMLMYRKVSMV